MAEFLSANWVWILPIGAMLVMHVGHGRHGGTQGGHGGCGGGHQHASAGHTRDQTEKRHEHHKPA